VEFFTHENPFPWMMDMDYRDVRTERYKYIHWMQHPDEAELYDLAQDPYEMHNLAGDPSMAGVVADLRRQLGDLELEALGLSR